LPSPPAPWSFVSAPGLHPPKVTVTTHLPGTSGGYVFVSPISSGKPSGQLGPMILDSRGDPVWVDTLPAGTLATNLRVQIYMGKPVLTWWQGRIFTQGYGDGVGMIADSSYRVIATVRAGNGFVADLHELLLTPNDTALITAYRTVPHDTSTVGGALKGTLLDSAVQEIDAATGRVVFQWDALNAVPPSDTYAKVVKSLWDPYHLNSVDVGPSGDLLVSARNTWTVYDIDRRTGAMRWQLGGKHSSFALGPGVRFAYQHDARFHGADVISVFDNEAGPTVGPLSRALFVTLDMAARTAAVARQSTRPGVLANSQGNVQLLPNGSVFVGWGAQPYYSEFGPSGTLLYEARFPGTDESYRALRSPWIGLPVTPPAVAVLRGGGVTRVYASWNGATQVARWRVLTGSAPTNLKPLATMPRHGFETIAVVHGAGTYFAVQALNGEGQVLGTSATVKR
jgi:hypothetical protein